MTSLNSSTSITATTPSGTAGAKDVVVTNSDTQFGTLSGGYTYVNPTPTPTYVQAGFLANDNNRFFLSLMFSDADGGGGGSSTQGGISNAGCGVQTNYTITLPTSNGMNGSVYIIVINWDSNLAPHNRPGSIGTRCQPLTGTLTRNGVFHSNLVFTENTLTGGWTDIVISGFTSGSF